MVAGVARHGEPTGPASEGTGTLPGRTLCPVSEFPNARYAKSGGLSIAYATYGDGPFDVVFVPGFVSHVEMGWDLGYGPIRRRLGSIGRLIFFDKRGTGMSDRVVGMPPLEERMDDVRAVMDAAECDQAAIVGISEGGPLSLVFAATYPDRVRSLVLWDTSACFSSAPDYPVESPQRWDRFPEMMEENWGTGLVLSMLVKVHGDLPRAELERLLGEAARFERNWATPGAVRQLMDMNQQMDCRPVLPAISAPTLVVHRSGDPIIPVGHGRWLADHIEGARYREFDGDFHCGSMPGDDDDVLDEIDEFLTGTRHAAIDPDRVLSTVLFTDIVGSTEKAAELGDGRWRRLLDDTDGLVHRSVERFRGRIVKSTGDGHLATFDGPARGVRCAAAIRDGLRTMGLEIRSGLHTGEIELRRDDIGGLAVHIGARVGALAAPNEVLVSSTVKDLVVGSGIQFDERGEHELKGVPGSWRLFAVRD
jgi:pimeloyl-ACP methyl ester carboxylesterase